MTKSAFGVTVTWRRRSDTGPAQSLRGNWLRINPKDRDLTCRKKDITQDLSVKRGILRSVAV
jgi:hypothetical protein